MTEATCAATYASTSGRTSHLMSRTTVGI